MSINSESSIAELRSELDRKRSRALDLQISTTDPDEWSNLNTIRWDLEDMDKDLYLSQFIKNNDRLRVLIGQIEEFGEEARRIAATLETVTETLKKARAELKNTSAMFGEIDSFYTEIDELVKTLREE